MGEVEMDGDLDAGVKLRRFSLLGVEETGRILGEGCLSVVAELRYKGLPCAGKTFRPQLAKESDSFLRRLGDLCELQSELRHPNIVSFLGVYEPARAETSPVIVTEALPTTLARCIERHGPLPTAIGYEVLEDVALGLRYLHERSPPVVHRDLSATNVLLTRGMSAKIADVGIAAAIGVIKKMAHLPPEVFKSDAPLTVKVDVYSFGVLIIHTLTGRWLETDRSSLPDTSLHQLQSLSFTEAGSLSECLQALGEENPLMDLVLQCLQENPEQRPEMSDISRLIGVTTSSLPTPTSYLEILQTLEDGEIERADLEQRMGRLSFNADSEVEKLQVVIEKLKAKNIALQAAARVRVRTGSCPTYTRMEVQSQEWVDGSNGGYSPVQLQRGSLTWTACASLPVGMYQANSIVIDRKVYIGGGVTGDPATDRLVFEYDTAKDSWSVLPPAPVTQFGLGQMFGELVLIGGKNLAAKATNKVYTYDRAPQMWKQSIPPLLNARYSPAVVSYRSALLACGGFTQDQHGHKAVNVVTTVEAITMESFQWYIAGYLPRSASLSRSSCVTIHDACYLIGGYRYNGATTASQSTHRTSLPTLLSELSLSPYMWKELSNTPHFQSTGASLGGCLLALGGCSSPYTMPVQTSIHAYSPSAQSWVYIGDLPYACCHCTAVTLPSGELLVIGGWREPGVKKRSQAVYRGTIAL